VSRSVAVKRRRVWYAIIRKLSKWGGCNRCVAKRRESARVRYLCACTCVWSSPTYRRRSKRCSNFAGGGGGGATGSQIEREERAARVCSNLNFEFRRDAAAVWPPGGILGGSPGQPSDAVFGLGVLQFFNRIGRRRIPRDPSTRRRDTYVRMYTRAYVHVCIHVRVYMQPE